MLNKMLYAFGFSVQVKDLTQCFPGLWVMLYDALRGKPSRNITHTSATLEDVRAVISALGQDLIGAEIPHILPEDVFYGEESVVVDLIELMYGVYLVLTEDGGIDGGVPSHGTTSLRDESMSTPTGRRMLDRDTVTDPERYLDNAEAAYPPYVQPRRTPHTAATPHRSDIPSSLSRDAMLPPTPTPRRRARLPSPHTAIRSSTRTPLLPDPFDTLKEDMYEDVYTRRTHSLSRSQHIPTVSHDEKLHTRSTGLRRSKSHQQTIPTRTRYPSPPPPVVRLPSARATPTSSSAYWPSIDPLRVEQLEATDSTTMLSHHDRPYRHSLGPASDIADTSKRSYHSRYGQPFHYDLSPEMSGWTQLEHELDDDLDEALGSVLSELSFDPDIIPPQHRARTSRSSQMTNRHHHRHRQHRTNHSATDTMNRERYDDYRTDPTLPPIIDDIYPRDQHEYPDVFTHTRSSNGWQTPPRLHPLHEDSAYTTTNKHRSRRLAHEYHGRPRRY
jgi:hypothetical protein